MQSGYTGHITPAEWRWVILIGVVLVLIAFLPFILIVLSGVVGTQWQFMGVLHNYQDGTTFLSKILQGETGAWLVHFQHTPEPHQALFMQPIYSLLGQVAHIVSASPMMTFHVARIGVTLIMYMAIYQLAASIWMRVRTRRIFFILVVFGGGFGWLGALLGDTFFPDLVMPSVFPFQSSIANVHFPLGIAGLCLLASVMITVFRPGNSDDPGLNNGGLIVALLAFIMPVIYPEAFVVFGVGLMVYVGVFCIIQRRIVMWALRWMLTVVLPGLPLLILYIAFITYNPAMSEWHRQQTIPVPGPVSFALGLGIPLVLAVPGIYRVIRRFEPDGDQFMLIWLLAMVVAVYLPTRVQRPFAVGMMVPVAYFASRSLEDFWFRFVKRPWRYRLLVALLPVMFFSHLLVLASPIIPLLSGDPGSSSIFLQTDYAAAFQWLGEHTQPSDVILASPEVSTWLPAWLNARVVYGHPFQTLESTEKLQAVLVWYQLGGDDDGCDTLLQGEYAFRRRYTVRYVIVGPQERALGKARCASGLRFVAGFGSVNIYVPQPSS